MGWQQDKAAVQRAADAKLKNVSPAKKAAFAKLTRKIQSGQNLTSQENYAFTHNFPEFFDKPMFDKAPSASRTYVNDQDRGSNPMRQGLSGLPNFGSSPSNRGSLAGGTPVPRGTGGGGTFGNTSWNNYAFPGGPTNAGIFYGTGKGDSTTLPGSQIGNSLASWPSTTFSNPASYWATHQAPGMASPPVGSQDRDRGSDPMRVPPPDLPPFGINDQDRGSDPMRRFPTGHEPDSFPGDQSPSSPGGDFPLITKLPDEQFPNIPKITLSWHDFTNEARQKVAGAYAPLYQAINQGRTNATNQSTRSQAVVKGMYDQLAASDTAANTATSKKYDAAISAGNASDKALQDAVAGAGASANADLAATMAAAGLGGHQGTAAADILSGAIGRDSAAGLAAKTQATANQTELQAQKLAEDSYGNTVVSADRQTGTAAREGLINQLSQVLQGYDQQKFSTTANEAQQALSLNQQMGQNDWTAQTGSADQTWNAYNAAMGQTQAKIGIDQANVGLENQAVQSQIDAQAAAAEAARKAYEFQVTSGQSAINEEDKVAQQQADRQSRDAIAAAELEYKNAQTPIAQQKAWADLIRAQNSGSSGSTRPQGIDPSFPNYSPLADPTSPAYQAAHNPQLIWRQGTLGITAGLSGNNPQVNQQRADALGAYVESEFAKAADELAQFKGLPPGVGIQHFKDILVRDSKGKGFSEVELAAAAEAYQKLQAGPATVIPGK